MKVYQLKTTQIIPATMEQAWDFFSTPKNLATITPKEMSFTILTKLDDRPIYKGMLIDYIVKPLFGIPLHWRTEITEAAPTHFFTDKQVKGPFKLWEHSHVFENHPDGVLMTDIVNYSLPLGFIGRLAHSLLIKQKVADIFAFRKNVIDRIFNNNEQRVY